MPTQADLYLRLSDFRKDDRDSFPARESALRAEASRLGWGVHRVVIENDVDPDGRRKPASAFKRKLVELPGGRTELRVYRAGFRSVLDDLMAGRAQAVLAEDLDRACRDPRDLEDLIDACEEKRANARSLSGSLVITNGGTDAEITTARIMVTMANKASRDARRRMEDSRTRRARDGLWGGNGHRPFGFRLLGAGRLAIAEDEAAVLRQAAAEVLSENFRPFYLDGPGRPPGAESLTTLAAGLRDAGMTTPGGKQWTAKQLREALIKPSVAGLVVVHERDRDKGTEQVTLAEAGWEPIVSRETWEAVRARLTDPARLTHTGNVPRHLGTGIYECGACGGTVKVNGGSRSKRRSPSYVCRNPECRKVRRLASGVDDYVVAHLIARLERPDLADLLRPAPSAEVDVAALRKRRTVLVERGKAAARLFALGDISEAEYAEAARVRKAELDKIATDLAIPAEADPLSEFRDAPDAGEAWRGLTLARRRAVIRLLVRVRLLPSPPTGPGKFRPETVEVTGRV
jgi:DNA invertase Pin-like site-specific DNA recombinase